MAKPDFLLHAAMLSISFLLRRYTFFPSFPPFEVKPHLAVGTRPPSSTLRWIPQAFGSFSPSFRLRIFPLFRSHSCPLLSFRKLSFFDGGAYFPPPAGIVFTCGSPPLHPLSSLRRRTFLLFLPYLTPFLRKTPWSFRVGTEGVG